MLWIRGILVQIRIRGSVPLTDRSRFGSGSGYWLFRQWLTRCQQKIIFHIFLFITWYTSISLQRKKSKTSHNIEETKVFLTFLCVYKRIRIRENNYRSGFGRTKNIRILRIRIQNTAMLDRFHIVRTISVEFLVLGTEQRTLVSGYRYCTIPKN